jgi:hypothetical protein
VVRSARGATIAVLGLSTLAGCATTQQQAARLQLNDARLRASAMPLRLGGRSRTVSVASVSLVTGRSAAVIVTLRNDGARPASDLPLLVGATTPGGRSIDLNAVPQQDYFRNHIPAIQAHGLLQWVLTLGRSLPTGSVPFAKVGVATGLTATRIGTLPLVRALPGRGTLIKVENASSVPQYQLQVYAVARHGGRYVAAGQAAIADLGSGSSAQLRMPVVGDASGTNVSLEAPPTIFK